LWTELGVAGTQRRHSRLAIFPEELLLLTSALATRDPRLRDESIDWCSRHHRYVSTARLRGLLRGALPWLADAFSTFAATVNHLGSARWPVPTSGTRWDLQLSQKSRLPSLDRPALLHLRLRALFGTGARADVVAALLERQPGNREITVTEVAELGYTKRNVANVLNDLEAAGLLVSHRQGNRLCFGWARRSEFEATISPLPDQIPRWRPIVDLLLSLFHFTLRTEEKSARLRRVEAAKGAPALTQPARRLGWSVPSATTSGDQWTDLVDWGISLASELAAGTIPSF
jgi:DNA-binding transcriptional ArsR family regulator